MKNTKQVGGITVAELTVADLDSLLGPVDYVPSMLDRLFEDDMVTGGLLAASTGMTVQVLSAMKPSALRLVADGFKEVNPDFFEMARREIRRAEEMTENLKNISGNAFVS